MRQHGYVSVVEFMENLPDTVYCDRPDPRGDWVLYDTHNLPLTTSEIGNYTCINLIGLVFFVLIAYRVDEVQIYEQYP